MTKGVSPVAHATIRPAAAGPGSWRTVSRRGALRLKIDKIASDVRGCGGSGITRGASEPGAKLAGVTIGVEGPGRHPIPAENRPGSCPPTRGQLARREASAPEQRHKDILKT